MSKQEAIKNALTTVKSHGYEVPAEVVKSVSELDNPNYRVAIVGKFQVGKSTLVNNVFLGGNKLLAEGRGVCTTALATDIEYGNEPSLQVYRWKDETHTEEEAEPRIVNPTPEDVDSVTASKTMDARNELAKRVSRVKITEPNDALEGFTIIDTPGLDDPNRELLLNTTYRIIPKSDVALLVVECRSLDAVEKELLRNSLIGQGISKVMILVSYKPNNEMDAEQRAGIVANIKAELASIGRSDIPVEIYCYDKSVEDILCDVSEIRMAIRSYLEKNALPGREERVTHIVRKMLGDYLLKIATEIKMAETSEAEKADFTNRLDEEEKKFKSESRRVFDRMSSEMLNIENDVVSRSNNVVDLVFKDFYSSLEKAENASELQSIVSNADVDLKNKLTEKMAEVGAEMHRKIQLMMDRYAHEIEGVSENMGIFFKDELGIKGSFIMKIPSFVWTILDIVSLDVLLPGGFITATIVKIIIEKIPILKNLTLGVIVKTIALKQLKTNLDEAKVTIKQNIQTQLHENLQNACDEIKRAVEDNNVQHIEAVRTAAANANNETSSNLMVLKSAKEDLERALAALN